MCRENEGIINSQIQTQWTPVFPAFGCKALAAVIQSEEFKASLAEMLNDFDDLEPNQITNDGYEFVGLSEKKALFEKHFPFFSLKVQTQFISLNPNSQVVTCEAALYVLTEEGYKPWFTRLGQSSTDNVGADGREADAETSALRRIFLALGMGKEGSKEVTEDNSKNAMALVSDYCKETGKQLKELVKEYRSHHQAFALQPFKLNYSDVEDTKLPALIDKEDWVLLTSFITKRKGKND